MSQGVSTVLISERQDALAQSDPFRFARRLQTPVWVFDIDARRISYANAAACDLWQATSEDDLKTRDLGADMSPTVAKRMCQYQADFIAQDATFNEMWTLYPNGKPQSVKVNFTGFTMPDGRMAMQCEVMGQTIDEPENMRSAEALLHTDVMIALYDLEGSALYLNPAARNAVVLANQSLRDWFMHGADFAVMMMEINSKREHRIVTKVNTQAGPRWYDISAKNCLDAVTGDPAILVTAIDVSELKNARDKARYLADRDQLTGCYNRAFLQHHMGQLAMRQSQVCALIYFDIDRFKGINDQFGHEMGDVVLRELADRTRRSVGADNVLVRLGGDEFILLIEPAPPQEELSEIIETLRTALGAPMTYETTRLNLGVSLGVTQFNPSETAIKTVIREADIALYAAKQAGRNRCVFFSAEMGEAARERDLIEAELKSAVANNEFVLFYQPRVDLKSGCVVSAEALVRWQHPTRGLIMPDKFIPVCEDTGMIEDLGQLIVEMGCNQIIAWQAEGFDIDLSINISPRQFGDKRLMQSLQQFAAMPGFPRGKVELEITENVLIGDHEEIARKLEAITRLGYSVAIDDFGTGYSNLSYISRFPLTCLKIDRSFINQLPQSGPIVDLILALGRQIGATVVAEGVEERSEYTWLTDAACNQVQGYFVARPLPLAEFRDKVAELHRET